MTAKIPASNIQIWLVAASMMLLPLGYGAAEAKAQALSQQPNIAASLDVESERPAPGDTITLAIVMEPKPGWHDYWLNPADAGTPLELEWDLPDGVTASDIRAPVPKTLMVGGFMNYVYERDHAFLIDLKIAKNVPIETPLRIKLDAAWSACSDRICVAEGEAFITSLIAGEGRITGPDQLRFDQYRQDIPPQINSIGTFKINAGQMHLAIPYPASASLSQPYFFPFATELIDHSAPQTARRTGDYIVISAPLNDKFGQPPKDITGLLHIADNQGLKIKLKAGDVPAGGEPVATLGSDDLPTPLPKAPALWLTLGAALLGGLLLNLMPCVFPILGLKAISLAKMGGAAKSAQRDALAYSAGVIFSCLTLGMTLLLLRAGGEQIGWAFQLQEPVIVLLLLLLIVTITANLAGLFEITISASAGKDGDGGTSSFGTGVLAAIVATPCTGPFMAAALGAALLLPTVQALLLFVALGLGLALPYLAIAYIPALRSSIPRPGAWMEKFRFIMAAPMLLTAIALGWLLWRLSGLTGVLVGTGATLLLMTALCYVRAGQHAGRSVWIPASAALAMATIAALVLPSDAIKREAADDGQHTTLPSKEFSEARLGKLRQSGQGVFVYFTADWCVTCKINEGVAIERQATADAFAAKKIVVLKGDFTSKDPEMARSLAKYGRVGVPLYIWFAPGEEGEILPQILTPSMLTNLQ